MNEVLIKPFGLTITSDRDYVPPLDFRTILYCPCPTTVLVHRAGIYEVDALQFTTHFSTENQIKRVRLFSKNALIRRYNGDIWIDDCLHEDTDCDIIVNVDGQINLPKNSTIDLLKHKCIVL